MSIRAVITDYYSGKNRPYQNILRDSATDEPIRGVDALNAAFAESGAVDGDEVEIIVRKTGRRPFGDRKVRLIEPHTYEREK